MTFALTIPDEMMEMMHIQSGIYDPAKLCRQMVAMYQWALDQACDGKQIVAEDLKREVKTICRSDTFDNINRRRKNYSHGIK